MALGRPVQPATIAAADFVTNTNGTVGLLRARSRPRPGILAQSLHLGARSTAHLTALGRQVFPELLDMPVSPLLGPSAAGMPISPRGRSFSSSTSSSAEWCISTSAGSRSSSAACEVASPVPSGRLPARTRSQSGSANASKRRARDVAAAWRVGSRARVARTSGSSLVAGDPGMRMRFEYSLLDGCRVRGVGRGTPQARPRKPWTLVLTFGRCSAERLPQPTGCSSSAFAPVTMKTTDWAIATA